MASWADTYNWLLSVLPDAIKKSGASAGLSGTGPAGHLAQWEADGTLGDGGVMTQPMKLAGGMLTAQMAAPFPNGTILAHNIDTSKYRTLVARLTGNPSGACQIAIAGVHIDGTSYAEAQWVSPSVSSNGDQAEVMVSDAAPNNVGGWNSRQQVWVGRAVAVDVRLNCASGSQTISGTWDLWGFP